jgi:PadR family transcriptional regulator, regulatory protein PadR
VALDTLVTQMRKGALEYCVLALLTTEPRYGFEIVQRLGQIDGMLTSEGTMYPLLGRLRRDRLVQSEWKESAAGPPRRYYELTGEGRRSLRAFREEWITFRTAVDSILGTGVTK